MFYGNVVPVSYPTISIPSVAIPTLVKTDEALYHVINLVHTSDPILTDVNPTTTEVQNISETVTKYTLVMETEEKKEQIVIIYNS